jgi:hypothetical protein
MAFPTYIPALQVQALRGNADGYYGPRVSFHITAAERREFPELKDVTTVWLCYRQDNPMEEPNDLSEL